MRLLNTLLWCIKCEAGTLLPAQMVLQIVQTCIRITCSPRISDLLSSMAKNVLKEMVTCQSSHPPADTHAHARARTHAYRRMGTAWEVGMHTVRQGPLSCHSAHAQVLVVFARLRVASALTSASPVAKPSTQVEDAEATTEWRTPEALPPPPPRHPPNPPPAHPAPTP
jgi:hypothetical protein